MTISAGDVYVELTGDSKSFQEAVKSASTQLNKLPASVAKAYASVETIGSKLESLGGKWESLAKRMGSTKLSFGGAGGYDVKKSVEAFNAIKVPDLAKATEAPSKIAAVGDALGGLSAKMLGLAAAYVTVQGAAAAFNMAREAAVFTDAKRVFEATGQSLQDFRDATKGMISDAQLVQRFGLARSMGLSAEEFKKFAVIADAAAKVTGQSQQYMFESIAIGAARSSKPILDNLGILVDWEAAHREWAKAHHTSVQAMTAAEKKQAELNQVMERGMQIVAEVSGVGATVSDAWDQFDSALGNLATTIGTLLIPAMKAAVPLIVDMVNYLNDLAGVEAAPTLIDRTAEAIGELRKRQSELAARQKDFARGPQRSQSGMDWYGAQISALEDRIKGITGEYKKQADHLEHGRRSMQSEEGIAANLKHVAEERRKVEEDIAKIQAQHLANKSTKVEAQFQMIGFDAQHKLAEMMKPFLGSKREADEAMRVGDALISEQADQAAAVLESTGTLVEFEKAQQSINDILGESIMDRALENDAVLKHAQALNIAARDTDNLRIAFDALGYATAKRQSESEKKLERSMGPDTSHPFGFFDPSKLSDLEKDVLKRVVEPMVNHGSAAVAVSQTPGTGEKLTTEMIAGGLTNGVQGAAGVLGTAIGGAAGMAMGGFILEALAEMASTIASTITDTLTTLFSDERIGKAVGGAQSGLQAAGAAAGIAVILGPTIVALTAVFAALVVVSLGTVVILAALILVAAAIVAVLVLWPVVMIGLFGSMVGLATATKSYARMQGAVSIVMDRIVGALEPFFANMLALVGLFSTFANVFVAMVQQFENSALLYEIMFEVVKGVAVALAIFGYAVAIVYDLLNQLAGGLVYLTTWLTNGFDADKAKEAQDAVTATGINLDNLNAAMAQLIGLTNDKASADGAALAATWDQKQATDALTDSLLNAPAGFRVEAYRFASQNNTGGSSSGGGDQNSSGQGAFFPSRSLNVYGDLTIVAGDRPIDKILDDLDDMTMRNTAQNTGNGLGDPMAGKRHRGR